MNRAMAQATRSPSSVHLEQARQRLRQRFQSKFLDTMKDPSPPPPVVTMPKLIHPASNDLLEQARLRIRHRFLDKFPTTPATNNAAVRTSGAVTSKMASPSKHAKMEHLEAARLRIRERFQDKFPDFTAFPETVETLQHALNDTEWGSNAVVVTSATHPFPILNVNTAWEDLCGFTEDQVLGETFQSLGIQGEFTEADAILGLAKKLKEHDRAAVHLTNATKDGTLFRNYLRIAPLYSNDEVTHFVGVLQAQ